MSFKLRFKEQALQEWHSLDHSIREQFAKKLHTLKDTPRIESSRLSGMKDCYKKNCGKPVSDLFTKYVTKNL